jgi:hypothetical protein
MHRLYIQPQSSKPSKESVLKEEEVICQNLLKTNASWVLMAHCYNPSYSGGRDQEDHSLKPAQANSLQDPISKNPFTKKDW